jgi:ABC-type transport system involved in multi-copper enzyme maturation permease subunit
VTEQAPEAVSSDAEAQEAVLEPAEQAAPPVAAPAPGAEGAAPAARPRRRPTLRGIASAIGAAPRALARLLVGPIFQRDVIGAGRRRGPYALRFLYAIILLTVVSIAFAGARSSITGGSTVAAAQSLQQVAPAITFTIGWFMLLAMAIVGPALTGGAIADEKRARTLSALMTTPLTSLEIVVGKLASRTVQIVVLALLAAPLLLAMRLFGGVPAMAVVGVMAISLSLALLGAAVALMFSIWHRRGTSAMGFAMLTLGVVSFGPMLLWLSVTRFTAPPPDYMLATCALFAMFSLQGVDPSFGSAIPLTMFGAAILIPLWAINAVYHLLAAAGAIVVASVGLRRVMVAEASGGGPGALSLVRRRPRSVFLGGAVAAVLVALVIGLMVAAGPGAAAGALAGLGIAMGLLVMWAVVMMVWWAMTAPMALDGPAPGAALRDARYRRASRHVGDSPVLWRELRQSSFNSRVKLALSLLAAFGIPAFLWIRFGPSEETIHGMIVSICLIGAMLQAAVMTTSAVGGERESGSWETLLTTPLGAWQILGGKLAGALRRQWLLPSVAVLDLLLAALGGWLPWILLFQTIIIFAGPVVLLSAGGVVMSLLVRRPTVAAVWNLSWALALWLGTWIVIGLLSWVTGYRDEPTETLAGLNFIISPVAMLFAALDGAFRHWPDGEYYIANWSGISAGLFTRIALAASAVQVAAGLGLVWLAAARFNRLTGRSS